MSTVNKTWHERFIRSGYFLATVLLHLIIFLLLATCVIFKAPPPPPTDEFHAVAGVKIAPPPSPPPSSGAAANNPQFEPQAVVVPVVTPPSMITTANSSAFKIDALKELNQAQTHFSDQLAKGTGLSQGGGGLGSGPGNGFGSLNGTSAQLTGYFIDLKQTIDKKPTGMTQAQYLAFLAEYISKGWDDSMFNPYYKSKVPIYTDAYAISTRPSEEAPKAFGLENEVQPGLWVVHYHAKVEAPQVGNYRLVGFADNVMMVKIRGETVLDGGWDSLSNKAHLHESLPFALPSYVPLAKKIHIPNLKIGQTFHMDVAEPVDMDVLIGDGGGVCSFFLLIEKEENTYEKLPDGTPKLPFFQIGSRAAPTFSDSEEHPPYSTTPEPWQAAPD